MTTTFGAVAALARTTPPAPTPLVTATSPRARAAAILRKASTPEGRGAALGGAAIGGDLSATHARDRALHPQPRHGPPGLGPFGAGAVGPALPEGGRGGGGAVRGSTAIRASSPGVPP